MKKLFIRMMREIKSNLGQFISLVLVIAVGSFMFTGLFATITSIQSGVDQYYENQNLADVWARYQEITEDQVQEWNSQENLDGAIFEGRMVFAGEGMLGDQDVNLRLYSMTEQNQLYLREGVLPENDNQMVVDTKFAEANQLELGSSFTVVGKEMNTVMTIVGIGDSPENAWKVNDGSSTVTKHKTFTIGYTTLETMKDLTGKNEYSEVLVQTDDPVSIIKALEVADSYVSSTVREDNVSVKAVQGGIDTIGVISYIFPIIFFLVGALIAFISMCKMVENQRTQIAVMQALGISKRVIRMGFLVYALFASLLGSFGFALLGNFLIPRLLMKMFTNRYIFPDLPVIYHPIMICLPFILGFLFCGVATMVAMWSVLREVPAQAMRPRSPKQTKAILIERITVIWRRLGYSTKLVCRNIFLNKGRILLSSIGVVGSVTLMITGLSLRSSANMVVNQGRNQIGYDISIAYHKPITEQDILTSLEDISVSESDATIELSQTIRTLIPTYEDQSMNIQILPLNSQALQLVDQNRHPITVPTNGIIIASCMAEEYGIAVGDNLIVEYKDQDYTMPVRGITMQYTGNTAYISEEYAKEIEIGVEFDTAFILCSDSNQVNDMADYFGEDDAVKSVTTRVELTDSTGDSMAMLNTVIKLIIIAASILSITVIYNITAINIFERTRELATLMVLGHYKNESARLVFTENFVISGVGFLIGIPFGMLLFHGILDTFKNAGILLPQTIGIVNIIVVLGIIILLSFATNILLKGRIKRIDMVESLKSVE